jgi:hypothetical protein
MEKRKFLTGLLGLAALPFAAKAVEAAGTATRNKATWTVPKGIDKIRISSTGPDGSKIFSRELTVEPGQTFFVEAV